MNTKTKMKKILFNVCVVIAVIFIARYLSNKNEHITLYNTPKTAYKFNTYFFFFFLNTSTGFIAPPTPTPPPAVNFPSGLVVMISPPAHTHMLREGI